MAQLTFPITSDGLVADVIVNLEMAALIPLRLSGQGPSPISGKGLIDTGSDITAIGSSILQGLAIPSIGQATTQSIGGPIAVNLYRVSLHIFDSLNTHMPWISQPSLVVMELDPSIPFEVLIGMDVGRQCRMFVDGPANHFTMDL